MTVQETMPAYTRHHWAKSDRGDHGRIHLLEHHLADVGACFEALLAQPTIRQRLASTAGLADLDDATVARLCVFAALHDIGKVNVGFQTQIWRREDLPGGRRPASFPGVGHTRDMVPVLDNNGDTETSDWFFSALGFEQGVLQWDNGILQWDDNDGMTACGLFVATLSHHGDPLNLQENLSRNPRAWQRFTNLNPRECVERVGRLVRQWFPDAFTDNELALPSAPAFQHHFLGLCTLADWIGSNEIWFKFVDAPDDDYIDHARRQATMAVKEIGLDISQQRTSFASTPPKTDFADLFAIPGAPPPNAIQRQSAKKTPLNERLVIIESETGSGKTEAALWRFARMYQAGLVDGIYFALPTRVAASQIHRRVENFVARLFPGGNRPPVVLAVPGYDVSTDAGEVAIPQYDGHAAGHHESDKPWAADDPKRYLAAQIAAGTVDQAMLGALKVKHAHLRASCLARNLLVVDEVHASDTYMTEILQALLNAHIGAGGYALLMSATLGSDARQRWLTPGVREGDRENLSLEAAIQTPYPAISVRGDSEPSTARVDANDQGKNVQVEPSPAMSALDEVAQRALTAARSGAKVLVVRNTVNYAVETQQALESAAPDELPLLFAASGRPTLHHSRFAHADRRLLDAAVEERLGKDRNPGGCIVVGTQTLEQSLDIDADLLITDLCPVDVLLQRIGRLHRHRREDRPTGYDKPVCIVLTPPGDDLSPLLAGGQTANGLGPHGFVYRNLHSLQATLRLVNEYAEWRIPEMNRELVERATHPEALARITEELGDAWQAHANDNTGGYIADRQTARNHILRTDRSFYEDNREVCFPGIEETVRTRLGDDRLEVAFDPQPSSPFDSTRRIDRLDLPLRWLSGAEVPEKVETTPTDGGFEFAVGSHKFCYDRLGLRRI